MGRKPPDEQWLRRRYVDEMATIAEIADELGLATSTVRHWFGRYGIESRGRGGRVAPEVAARLADSEWMTRQYIHRGRTSQAIADELGVAGRTVRDWLGRHGVTLRPTGSSAVSGWAHDRLADPRWLRRRYRTEGATYAEIAAELGVHETTVRNRLLVHGIEPRPSGVAIPDASRRKLADREWLAEQYAGRYTTDVAEDLDVSVNTVLKYVHEHGLEAKPQPENLRRAG